MRLYDIVSDPYLYSDVIISAMASQTTGVSIVCFTVCSGANQRIHQSSASLAFVRGIHRWVVDPPHKGPVTRKRFPFDDVIIWTGMCYNPISIEAILCGCIRKGVRRRNRNLSRYLMKINDKQYDKKHILTKNRDCFRLCLSYMRKGK